MRPRAVIVTIAGAALLIVGLAMVGTGLFVGSSLGSASDADFRFVAGAVLAMIGGVLIYVGPGLGRVGP